MNRRAFVKAFAGVIVGIKAAGLVEISAPPVTLVIDGPAVAAAVVAELPASLEAGELVMLPTEGLFDMVVSMHTQPIDCGGDLDGLEHYIAGPTTYNVELTYLTDEPIDRLNAAVIGSERCRLEAFGYRIDGFVVSVQPAGGHELGLGARQTIVTTVEFRPTGMIVEDERFEHDHSRGIAR